MEDKKKALFDEIKRRYLVTADFEHTIALPVLKAIRDRIIEEQRTRSPFSMPGICGYARLVAPNARMGADIVHYLQRKLPARVYPGYSPAYCWPLWDMEPRLEWLGKKINEIQEKI